MNRTHLRLATWVLAMLTSFVLFGTHTAYAWDSKFRVEAAGWYLSDGPTTNGNEIKFGVTGKCDNDAGACPGGTSGPFPKGRFEYFDTVNGMRVDGKLDSAVFYTATITPPDLTGMTAIDQCPNALPPAFGGPAAGSPGVRVHGTCDRDEPSNCSFTMNLIDGGDPGRGKDFVCDVAVGPGQTKNHTPVLAEGAFVQPLQRGNIKVRNDH